MASRAILLATWLLTITASAQVSDAPPPAAVPESPAAAIDMELAPPAPAAATAAPGCERQCLSGFACIAGACVSRCSPPCTATEACSASGECAALRASFFDGSVPPAPPRRGVHEHDGFYWRFMGLSAGFGSVSARVPTLRPNRSVARGAAAALTGDLGGAVTTNLIVFARSSMGLNAVRGGGGPGIVGMGYGFIAPGIMYFLMPINMYFGGALGLAQATLIFDGDEAETGLGLGVDLDAGKEFWVDDDLGIDLGVRFRFMTLPAGELREEPFADSMPDDSAVLSWSLLLAASVTYN